MSRTSISLCVSSEPTKATVSSPTFSKAATLGPGIAGRTQSYMMRQLWDLNVGPRKGPLAVLMQPTVANLTVADMTDIVAYLASLTPPTDAQ